MIAPIKNRRTAFCGPPDFCRRSGGNRSGRTHRSAPTEEPSPTARPAAAKRGAEAIRRPPRCRRHHPPRDGSIGNRRRPKRARQRAIENTLAPVRRPPCARRATAPECAQKRSFLLDRARPVFFSARPKRKWGVHCPAGNPAVIRQPNSWHPAGDQRPPLRRGPAETRAGGHTGPPLYLLRGRGE